MGTIQIKKYERTITIGKWNTGGQERCAHWISSRIMHVSPGTNFAVLIWAERLRIMLSTSFESQKASFRLFCLIKLIYTTCLQFSSANNSEIQVFPHWRIPMITSGKWFGCSFHFFNVSDIFLLSIMTHNFVRKDTFFQRLLQQFLSFFQRLLYIFMLFF